MNPTTGKTYRGGNALHLLATGLGKGYGDPRWMTYKQAFERGWQVRRGEQGTHIEFWEIRGGSEKSPEQDGPSEQASDRDQTRMIHRVYTVFNAQQVGEYVRVQYAKGKATLRECHERAKGTERER